MIYGNYLREKYNNTAVKIADAEGVPCVMEYSKGKNLRNYEIYGNSVQDGTPSPDNPIEIQSIGDLTTKNLLDYTTVSARSGMTVAFIDNGFVYTGNYYFEFDGSFLEIGSTYVMSWNFEGNDTLTPTWRLAYEDGTYSSTVQNGVRLKIAKSVSKILVYPEMSKTTYTTTFTNIQLELGSTATEYEPYHKYDIPITVRGKNLLPNSDWTSGNNSDGFDEKPDVNYITEYTQNSISFNLPAWRGVSSPRFRKDSVKRIVFKIDQDMIGSDGSINFYISIQGYDDNNNKVGNRVIYNNAVADTEYIFDFSTIASYSFYKNSTQFSFCILARKNALSNLIVYDIAYYAETDTAVYEPYIGETKHIYLNEPLRKVGDYADYIDFKNQKVVRNILKQSLNAYVIYKKLNNVIRISGWLGRDIKHKYDSHILSTIFNYKLGWSEDIEIIFHHTDNYYNFYWSVYWSRLGLTYDGTNVYRIDDTEQTPLTDTEIISIANEWLSTLSDKDKEIYVILDTPTEESISLPTLKTFKGTSIMSVDTTIQPSNIKTKYVIL